METSHDLTPSQIIVLWRAQETDIPVMLEDLLNHSSKIRSTLEDYWKHFVNIFRQETIHADVLSPTSCHSFNFIVLELFKFPATILSIHETNKKTKDSETPEPSEH
jgi:hypothetical protein